MKSKQSSYIPPKEKSYVVGINYENTKPSEIIQHEYSDLQAAMSAMESIRNKDDNFHLYIAFIKKVRQDGTVWKRYIHILDKYDGEIIYNGNADDYEENVLQRLKKKY